jgi:hypothetical protein
VHLGHAEQLLPISLRVAEVHDGFSRAIIRKSGLDQWQDDEYQPGSGDLVVARLEEPRRLAVFPLMFRPPANQNDKRETKWSEPGYRLRAYHTMQGVRDTVRSDLQDALNRLGMVVVSQEPRFVSRDDDEGTPYQTFDEVQTCTEAWQNGIRYAVGGFLSPLSQTKFACEIQLVELQPLPGGQARFGKVTTITKLDATDKRGLK